MSSRKQKEQKYTCAAEAKRFSPEETKRRSQIAKPLDEIGDTVKFYVEAFSAQEADYEQLMGSHPELAIIMCAAYFMGSSSGDSSLDFVVVIDAEHTWKRLVEWLDKNVPAFELRFSPRNGACPDKTKPLFWLVKDENGPVQRFLHDELYPLPSK